jgi:phosphopantothenoylcysteine decarboxylase/phosphopantothenate--cysteine ligase
VADWRPAAAATQKIKKDGSGAAPQLAFVENADILASVAASARAHSGALFCVGFAAESHDLLAHAQAKRLKKGVPLLVGNIGPATFGQDDNALLLVDAAGSQELPRASKLQLARQLVAIVAARLPTF